MSEIIDLNDTDVFVPAKRINTINGLPVGETIDPTDIGGTEE